MLAQYAEQYVNKHAIFKFIQKKFSNLDLGYAVSLTYQSSPDFLNNFRVLLVVTHSSVAGLPQTQGYAENINKVPIRPLDKSAYWKIIFFTSHPKHMLWVLKRTVSLRQFF